MRPATHADHRESLITDIRDIAEELHSMSSGIAMLQTTASQPSRAAVDQLTRKVEELRQLAEELTRT